VRQFTYNIDNILVSISTVRLQELHQKIAKPSKLSAKRFPQGQ